MVYTGPVVALPAKIETRGPSRLDGWDRGWQEYFPYGKASDRRDERNRYRFIGVERDETSGLLMAGPRTYDTGTSRFLQGEPRLVALDSSAYGYAASSPGRYVDWSGHQTEEPGLTVKPQNKPPPTAPASLEENMAMSKELLLSNPKVASRIDAKRTFSAEVRVWSADPATRVQQLENEARLAAEAIAAPMSDEEIATFTRTETRLVPVPFEGTY